MSFGRAVWVWQVLALVLAGIYLIAAIVALLAGLDGTTSSVLGFTFLVGGALLILLGIYFPRTPTWLAAALVSLGATMGGLPLFWTLIVPLAISVVIALSFAIARQEHRMSSSS
jgi:hypothetical protein